jgi:TRAP transporter 4TM/12TM fusion protein
VASWRCSIAVGNRWVGAMLETRRELTGAWALAVKILAALMPVTALIYALRILPGLGFEIYKEQFLSLFLTLCLVVTFLTVPPLRSQHGQRHVPWYDLLMVLLSLVTGGYVVFNYPTLVREIGLLTTDKVVISTVGIALILEAARRLAGLTMFCVGLLALAYAYFGNHLSGMFQTRVIRGDRLMMYNYLTDGAILGTPLFVAASIVTAFIVFGQMLFRTGGGPAISDFAFALMGRRRGGPAKVAVVGSAMFGSLSGSASANVATTGMLTIPMMTQVGYSKAKAGAIEAVASTGGLVLPPIMAATGFIMAEFLGVPYANVALAALVPALLFYICVYLQVDLEAAKSGIQGWKGEDLPPLRTAVVRVLPVLFPFAVLLYVLFGMSWSPESAAFIATGAVVVTSLIVPRMRRNLRGYLEVLASTGEAVVFVAVLCAVAGLVVGVIGLTGLGTSLATNLVDLAGGNVVLLLVFAAIGCIALGMGVPVTATYIILIVLIGPALIQAGVDPMAAHLFVFYFGTLSFLTPPVCISVFVAASIAKADPMKTALYALRFAVVAYLIPFAFVFNDSLLLHGDLSGIIKAVISALAGVGLLSIGLVGHFRGPVNAIVRALAIALGVAAFYIGTHFWLFAFGSVAALLGLAWWQRWRNGSRPTVSLAGAPTPASPDPR